MLMKLIKKTLLDLYTSKLEDNAEKIEKVTAIFKKTGSDVASQNAIKDYTQIAFDVLEKIDLSEKKKNILKEFASSLMSRNV